MKTPPKPGPPGPGKAPITLDQLPAECRTVLNSGGAGLAPVAEAKAAAKDAAKKSTAQKKAGTAK